MPSFIVPYDPAWATAFAALKQALTSLLKDLPADIQHVGSTAIPGLVAKPLLDIDIIIEKKELLTAITARLVAAGYHNRGDQGIPGRFAFRQSGPGVPQTLPRQRWQAHHLYVCYADSLALKNHLLFRDALLKDAGLVEEYALLKKTLADNPTVSREQYTIRKTEFILSVLAAAGMSKEELEIIAAANR